MDERAPVDDELGALLDTAVDPLDDGLAVLLGVDRAHVDAGLHARADLEVGDPLEHHRPQLVGRVTHGDEQGLGHAPLAGRAVAGGDGRVGGHLEVRVGQDDHGVLGAGEGADPLAALRALFVDVAPDGGRADELDGLDVGVLDDRGDGLAATVDDAENAVRQSGFLPQLGLELGGARACATTA